MSKIATPKSDQRAALREAWYDRLVAKAKGKAAEPVKPKPETIEAVRQEVSGLSNMSNTATPTEAFDKRAYQREYMRKKRAKTDVSGQHNGKAIDVSSD